MKSWSFEEIESLYHMPLMGLIAEAQKIHGEHHDPLTIQLCTLISIKTGGCPEDCKYCAQSARYQTNTKATPLMPLDEVIEIAKKAKANGSTRVCLGAAWRQVRDSTQFNSVLEMCEAITKMGLEVCCTLGMLTKTQAERLKDAGLYAYNHNLDTSQRFYKEIITTRTYEDRLSTLKTIKEAGIQTCCGGILGLGETQEDRIQLLQQLSILEPSHIPINILSQIPGTPLENQKKIPFWDILRMIATTRIVIPTAIIRLSAGRATMSDEQQTLCFIAGANSIFSGEKLLTVSNATQNNDDNLFTLLGLKKRAPYDTTRKTRTS